MSYQRILLLNPPYSGTRVKVVFCAGLGYIAEVLESSGIEYDVLDMSVGLSYRHLRQQINEFHPELIGLSMMTYRFKETYQLLRQVKRDFPKIVIVVGGAHVSLFREKVLEDCRAVDYGIIGEGEDIFVELCQGKDLNSIKGLLYRDGQRINWSGERPFIFDLDNRPFPKYRKFDLERNFSKTVNALPIVTSRGCPFDCIYCPVKFSIGKSFRMRSAESIVEELAYWYGRGYRRFSFADDNFTLNRERVVELCEAIKAKGWSDIFLSCDNGIRADRVDRGLLKLMREAGFYRIAFGVEAGNDKILKILHKNENIETIRARIQDACDLGFDVDLFFLVGSPGETWDDLQDSFKLAQEFPINAAYFYNIIPFPKTALYEWIEKNGRFLKAPEDYLNDYPINDNDPVFETPEMSYAVRKRALKEAFAITRRTMRRNYERRLSNLGRRGKMMAYLYTTGFVQDVLLRKSLLRRLIYGLANKMVS